MTLESAPHPMSALRFFLLTLGCATSAQAAEDPFGFFPGSWDGLGLLPLNWSLMSETFNNLVDAYAGSWYSTAMVVFWVMVTVEGIIKRPAYDVLLPHDSALPG